MKYEEYSVPDALSDLLTCYWSFTRGQDDNRGLITHYFPPDASISLIFIRIEGEEPIQLTSLFGPTKYINVTQIPPGFSAFGIRFRPGMVSPVFEIKGKDLRDKNIQPAPVLDFLDYRQIWSLFEDREKLTRYFDLLFTQRKEDRRMTFNPVINKIIKIIMRAKGLLKISTLLNSLPISERQAQKVFKTEVGLTIKEFAIVMRFRGAIIRMELEKKGYQASVFDTGYYDQSHFLRDFRNLSRISLKDFKKYIANIEHAGVRYRS